MIQLMVLKIGFGFLAVQEKQKQINCALRFPFRSRFAAVSLMSESVSVFSNIWCLL